MAKFFSIVALAAVALAVPQHAEHMGAAQVARSDFSLDARDISYDGSCGSWSGKTCPGSQCCSSDGWCGTSSTHCGTGCQAGFGNCGSGSAPSAAPSSSAPASSPPAPPSSAPASSPPAPPTTAPAAPASSSSPVAQNPGEGKNTLTSTTTVTDVKPTSISAPETSAAPAPPASSAASQAPSGSGPAPSNVAYKQHSGDGSTGAGWPAMSEWASFDQLWEINKPVLKMSCDQYHVPANTDDELNSLQKAIKSKAQENGVDERFAFIIAIQESGGCVRAPTTKSPGDHPVTNPGFYQDHDGKGHCQDGTRDAPSNPQTPCPDDQINQMAADGIGGTSEGDGLKQALAKGAEGGTSSSDAQTFYKAAKIYNAGSLGSPNLEDSGSTKCYASDIANRLLGWTTTTVTPCKF